MKDRHTDESMKLMAGLLQGLMPPSWGFTLLVFETGTQPAKVLYISSAQREDMLGTMQTMLDKWKAQENMGDINMN